MTEAELAVLGARPLTPDDPERVGRFRLLGVLGAGGMGRVYLGWSDGRLTAVKVIRPELADSPQFRRRFGHELEAVRRLNTGSTARLIDAEADATRPWMATEYVPGIPLDDAVGPQGSLPRAAVWRLAFGAANALQAIHQAGIIHRDLKPSNVILASDGPKVIDFGVAHASDLSQVTVTGQHVGTPSYMAPEQATTGVVGAASDVFALGGLLMFAATGRPPFGGGSPTEVLYRVVHQPPDLTGLRDYDPELHDLVSRCLHKDPEQRPTAAAVAAAVRDGHTVPHWPEPLRNLIEPRTAMAARTSLVEPGSSTGPVTAAGGTTGGLPRREAAAPTGRRRGKVFLAAALAVVLVAAGGVAATLLTRHQGTDRTASAASHATPSTSPKRSVSASASAGVTSAKPTPGPSTSPSASDHPPRNPGGTVTPPGAPGARTPGPGTSGGGNGGTVPQPAPSVTVTTPAPNCGEWKHQDPHPGTYAYLTGNYNLKAAPYPECADVAAVNEGRKVWFGCYVVNANGSTWEWVHVDGEYTSGWIALGRLSTPSGAKYRC
ncbi:protein kinase domain-containing protein [Streptomyces sp. YGL11-2]|uniref:serine/threonine-protein kinase n=1 Tax=Streptomyces sp. YGL11-2 TaxID=3414028 RepID=UPI003CFB9AD4